MLFILGIISMLTSQRKSKKEQKKLDRSKFTLCSCNQAELLLRCPICLEISPQEIIICTNGHSLHKCCSEKLSQCPICRGKLTKVRNLAAEGILESSTIPCLNQYKGCPEGIIGSDDWKDHLEVCEYRDRPTPFVPIKCEDLTYADLNFEFRGARVFAHFNNSLYLDPDPDDDYYYNDFSEDEYPFGAMRRSPPVVIRFRWKHKTR